MRHPRGNAKSSLIVKRDWTRMAEQEELKDAMSWLDSPAQPTQREVTNAAFPAGEGYAQETVEGSKRLFIPHFIATHWTSCDLAQLLAAPLFGWTRTPGIDDATQTRMSRVEVASGAKAFLSRSSQGNAQSRRSLSGTDSGGETCGWASAVPSRISGATRLRDRKRQGMTETPNNRHREWPA